MVPLSDILGELFSVGPFAKRVQRARETLQQKCGCELDILCHHPIEILQSAGGPVLAEAVRRVRKNEIHISPGFDGEYGRLKIFNAQEKEVLMRQKSNFTFPDTATGSSRKARISGPTVEHSVASATHQRVKKIVELD
jgi:PHP family Zn ribbon phosphoesterase